MKPVPPPPSRIDRDTGIRAPWPELDRAEVERYSRHLILPDVGMEGQRKLKAASIALVGAGGLGAPAALYLAAAGIGRLGLIDFDVVDESNLQRQVIHTTNSVGTSKLDSAATRIRDLNPFVQLDLHEVALTAANALEVLADYDIVIDGTDNFPTRYLVNDACVLLGKPNLYGSIFQFEGQASVFWAAEGPCYRCLFPEPPPPGLVPNCAEGGVLGVLPGIIGTLQANEAIKLILGKGDPLIGRLVLYDALQTRFRELNLRADPACALCGANPSIRELIDYEHFCGLSADQLVAGSGDLISPSKVRDRLAAANAPGLLDVRNRGEWEICRIDGATLIPLPELSERLNELEPAQEWIIYCKMGPRGDRAVQILREAGFENVVNLEGGILAWAEEIEPNLPRY